MNASVVEGDLTSQQVVKLKRRCRLLLLLNAAEQVGIAPLPSAQLHALVYLADVLSPVWDLVPFEGKVYKSEGGPRYPELQHEIDNLAVLGLIQAADLAYESRPGGGARIVGSYGLNFASAHLESILRALGARSPKDAIDPEDCHFYAYLVGLVGALATLSDQEIESATDVDVTYRDRAELHNVVDFDEWASDRWTANPSWRTVERFEEFIPAESKMLSGEKLYLYAAYLGRAMHAG